MERVDLDPGAIDDVIMGCLDAIGPQAGDIARLAWLSAGLPETVPGVTVDRQCGSGLQAVHFAAQAVMSGTQDLVVAGGVQSMSTIPIMGSIAVGESAFGAPDPFAARGWKDRYGEIEINQFRAADLIGERWEISREDMEEFAMDSHRRALEAIGAGRFSEQIVELDGVRDDEGPRTPDSAKIRSLPPLRSGGRNTAATSSQMSDGAGAILLASERALRVHNLTPRARVHQLTVLGDDPEYLLTAPIPATRLALSRCGLSVADISVIEINEAFASVVIAWMKELHFDPQRVNPNGGAIALGHPLGATGARLVTDLLSELERIDCRYGLVAMCEGGGQANVTILESVA
jgi:acetyl-CoA C-acetyltransferase